MAKDLTNVPDKVSNGGEKHSPPLSVARATMILSRAGSVCSSQESFMILFVPYFSLFRTVLPPSRLSALPTRKGYPFSWSTNFGIIDVRISLVCFTVRLHEARIRGDIFWYNSDGSAL